MSAAEPSHLDAAILPGTGPSVSSPSSQGECLADRGVASYVIRLALELDGEIIEERYVEPMEIVRIGHEQRSNLLCWGRLPRSVQLFEYDHKRQPIVLVSPRWLTQKNTHPLAISPHSHPSQRPIMRTPLLPGQCFTLDLDGALLHIERQDFFSKMFDDTHLDVPRYSPDTSSWLAPRVAICSMALSSLAYMLLLALSPGSSTFEEAPQLALAGSTAISSPANPLSSTTSSRIGTAQSASLQDARQDAPTRRLEGTLGHQLSWEEREVQRLLQSRSHHYRACFDASNEEHMMNLFFDLKIVPSTDRKNPSSTIEHVGTGQDATESHALLDCIVRNLHEVSLPRYERSFMVEFNILFEPSSP